MCVCILVFPFLLNADKSWSSFTIKQEEAAREEQLAMQKIAATLADLTDKRTAMVNYETILFIFLNKRKHLCPYMWQFFQVSAASRNIEDTNLQENKLLLQEMFKMQQVSVAANKELNEYAETVKTRFVDGTFESAETKIMIDSCLEEW